MEIIKYGKHYQLNQEKGTFVYCPECDKHIYIDRNLPYKAICTFCGCEFSFTEEDIDMEIKLDRTTKKKMLEAMYSKYSNYSFRKV